MGRVSGREYKNDLLEEEIEAFEKEMCEVHSTYPASRIIAMYVKSWDQVKKVYG